MTRRSALTAALASAGLIASRPLRALATPVLIVGNVTGLAAVRVARIDTPRSSAEVAEMVRAWPGQVAVGGGRYSMGGQVALAGGLHLDMRRMNEIVWLRPERRRVRVQAGVRWRDLQDRLDPIGLAVKTMQSYANFTVGGSVSVNAHGRYVGHGPVGRTVRALQLVLADGRIVEATPEHDATLFRAAIGGYGAVGVITEIELELADNRRIERHVQRVALDDYPGFFKARVLADPRSVMHNADLLPPLFDNPVCITWREAEPERPLTDTARLVPRGQRYRVEQNVIWALTELPGGQRVRRSVLHPLLLDPPAVKWLNREASLDVAELEPRTRVVSTYVLQEYFVPEAQCVAFARGMARVLQTHAVEALNVSVRHSPADDSSLLPWAFADLFSFVLYFKQRTSEAAQRQVAGWTRELIDLALAHGGRYYLPYQLHATQAQFDAAYPEASELRAVKAQADPAGRFSNELWRKYL